MKRWILSTVAVAALCAALTTPVYAGDGGLICRILPFLCPPPPGGGTGPAPVPEPATLAVLAVGAAASIAARRRRDKNK